MGIHIPFRQCRPVLVRLGLFVLIVSLSPVRAQPPNLALGKPYTLTPAPNYGLCTEAGDATQLTDGVCVETARGQIWVDPRCVGWRTTEGVEVLMDLGQSQPLGAIAIHSGAAPLADVYLPDAILAVSDDGSDFRVVRRVDTSAVRQTLRGVLRAEDLETRGRYVLVRLVPPYGQYVFVDEIEVFRGAYDPAQVKRPAERLARLVIDNRSELQKRLGRGLDRLEERLSSAKLQPEFAPKVAALREQIAALPGQRQGKFTTHDPAAAAALSRRVQELQAEVARRLHPTPRLAVTAVSPWAEILPGDVPGRAERDLTSLQAVMGRREYDSQALLLSNLSASPATVSLALRAPSQTGWQGQLQLRYAPFVQTPEGFPLADALPLVDRPLVSPPWESRLVWIGVHSGNSAPGTYQATLSFNGMGTRRVPLRLQVLPIRLPDDLPLTTYSWQYVDSIATLQGLETEAVADLATHYNNVAILSNNLLPHPTKGQVDAAGNITASLDFSDLDRWMKLVRPIATRGVTWFPSLRFDGQPGTPEFTTYSQWIQQLVSHLRDLGLDYDDFFVYPVDESIQEDLVASGQAIRAVDPKLRIFADPMMRDRDDVLKAAAPYVDIWCPAIWAAQPRQMTLLRETGKTLWSYAVCRRSLSPYSSYLLVPWKAFELGATGCGFWCYAVGDKWTNRDLWHESAALYAVIYTLEGAPEDVTCQEKIITSRRWEAWREGVEDYVWLWLLRERSGDDASARRVTDEAVRAVLAEPTDLGLADEHRRRVLRTLAKLR